MPLRLFALAACLILFSVPAGGVTLYQLPDDSLAIAATRLKSRDYRGARETALKAPPGGARDFLVGIASVRSARWDEAAEHLSKAADTFPLLADYALFYQGQALCRIPRYEDALAPLQRLLKHFPDSPLVRPTRLLLADVLFDKGDFPGALAGYQKFIETYPSGSDSLSASYRSALCREQLGDIAGTVSALRTLWITYPASEVAARAEADLQRIAAKAGTPPSYSAEELFKRAVTLYDLRKYEQAVKALAAIPREAQPEEFNGRLSLKTGQALFKSRRYRDAEQALAPLAAKSSPKGCDVDALFWLAKSLDKNGKEDEAVAAYLKLASAFPDSELADNALFEAAFVRKFQKKEPEAVDLFQRLLTAYPKSNLRQSALWEIAWSRYRSRDMKGAAELFARIAENENSREKALYWSARALGDAGDAAGAQTAISLLLSDYPFGFYALQYKKETRVKEPDTIALPGDAGDILPVPAGYERIKALISLGLHDEARKELAGAKRKGAPKNKTLQGLARLYLEMEDYNGAYALFAQDRPRKLEKENLPVWSVSYPLAYRDAVMQSATANGIPVGLIYAIMRSESSFSPTALSPAGARGLMQLMPATASAIAKGRGEPNASDSLNQPDVNISLGVRHFKDLLALYNGNLVAAVAAYNAGAGNVNRWRKNFGDLRTDEFIENIPFTETREYVKKVLTAAEIYARLYSLDGTPEAKNAGSSPSSGTSSPAPSPTGLQTRTQP